MPIKSVHITNYYHKNSGGISTVYNAILAAAGRHKRYVRLIVPGEEKDIEEVNDYAKIYYVPAKYAPFFDKRYRIMKPWDYMLHGSPIRDILLEEMPDMVEIRDKYTLSVFGAMVRVNMFRDLGRPMLVSFSSERMNDNIASFLMKGRFAKWFSKRVMGNYNFPLYDFHIANSAYTAEEFYESIQQKHNPKRQNWFLNWCWRRFASPRVPIEDRIRVCNTGIDNKLFNPNRKSEAFRKEMREKAEIPIDSKILLYSGRLSPEKNVQLLPEFMKIFSQDESIDFRLLVAGSGPLKEWLQEETDKHFPDKIIQLGHLNKDTLANYYANADVFIHSNPKEPFGLVPIEAMASGTITVLPNSGGVLSYANDENSWLAEATPEDFAEKIKLAVENSEGNRQKIEKALETSAENTFEKFTERLFGMYDEFWETFQKQNELFTDREASKKFDFIPLTKS